MRDCKKFCWKKSPKNITPPPVDYSKKYLTFEALEDGTFTFTFTRNALQYSLDDGTTWTTLAANTASPIVTAGNKILWKQTGLRSNISSGIGTFSATGNFNVSGNIMSLHYGDNFIGQTDFSTKIYALLRLFNDNTKLVSAENLILPATRLANFCYSNMFQGCTSLISAPELPATTLADGCYQYMFQGCTSLISAPELPATTLADGCYQYMFFNCTNLNYIKCLATNISASNCTGDWVDDVSSTGIFVINPHSNWEIGSIDGIPSIWRIEFDGYQGNTNYALPVSNEVYLELGCPLITDNNFLNKFIGWKLYVDNIYIGNIEINSGNGYEYGYIY